jgi:hypothetical protein
MAGTTYGECFEVDKDGDAVFDFFRGPPLSDVLGAVGEGALGESVLDVSLGPEVPTGFAIVEDVEAVAQAIRLRLQTRRGEDPFAPEVGLPVRQMVGKLDQDFIAGQVRRVVLADLRVSDVQNVETVFGNDTDRANRVVTVSFDVLLKDGRTFTLVEALSV